MIHRLMSLLAGLVAVLTLGSGQAHAADICNETSYVVEVAAGWPVEGGVAIEGWTRVRPGECAAIAEEADLAGNAPLYFYAQSSEAYPGGVREWRGTVPLCVDNADFEVVANTRCAQLGMASREFFTREGDERDRTVLVEPADYGDRAGSAAIQRLLQATGYGIVNIDGIEGRGTRRAISTFLSDIGRSSRPATPELIDAIESRALARNAQSGLTLCNEADGDIATTVGHNIGGVWQSRGWWRLHAGECARLLATRLESDNVFFYAERITRSGRGILLGGDESFCVGPARFVAEERTDCVARGYVEAPFRRIPEPQDGGVRLALQESDFRSP
ncbi:DUF1036 domain-containing protein [Maricaulis sp. CAU 1757]